MCSPMLQDRLRVPQDSKVKSPRISNNELGTQKCQDPLATLPRICNPKAMSNGRGPATEGLAHKICARPHMKKTLNDLLRSNVPDKVSKWDSVIITTNQKLGIP